MESTSDHPARAPWREVVHPVAEGAMRERAIPGVVIGVARGAEAPEYLAVEADAAGRSLADDTLFPVTSITKLATALAVLRLVAAGALALDDPLARHLPEAAAAQEGVMLRTILSHTAGLPDDLAPEAVPYTANLNWPALAQACLTTSLVESPGTSVRYSSVGFGLLAIIVERLTGRRFAAALAELVLAPLGVEGYLGDEPPRTPARIDGSFGAHTGTDLEPYNTPFWRSLAMPWGSMVTNAAGALALVRAFAGQPESFLPADLREEATRDQTGGLPGGILDMWQWPRCAWGLGVELHGDKSPHFAPAEAATTSFGQPGASGCLVWYDPVADVAWTLLGPSVISTWWTSWAPLGAAILSSAR